MDIITLALAKKFATKISAGYSKVEVDGMDIIFTLNDGSQVTLTVPAPADGVSVTDLDINENNELICTMSDGTTVNAGEVPVADLSEYAKIEYVDEENEKLKEELDNMKMVYNAMPKVSSEGIDLTLNNTAECPVYDVELKPSALEQATTTGKNLVNVSETNQIIYSTAYSNFTLSDGVITTTGNTLVGYKVKVNPNIQYTAQLFGTFSGGTNALRIRQYSSEPIDWDTNFIVQNVKAISNNVVSDLTVTTSETTEWILFVIYSNTSGLVCDKMQFELGDTATDYEIFTYGASPNPQYPQEIHTVSGDNTAVVGNKNLLDSDILLQATDWTKNEDEYVGNTRNLYNKFNTISLYNGFKENTQYSISFETKNETTSGGIRFEFRYTDGTNSRTSVTSNMTTYTKIYLTSTSNKTIASLNVTYNVAQICYIKNLQLEVNTSNTDYVPHQSQTYPLSLGNLEYCKIGDYEDLFFKNVVGSEYYDSTLELNKWYLKKNIKKLVLNGTENWGITGSETDNWFYRFAYTSNIASGSVGLSNYYSWANITSTTAYEGILVVGGYVRIRYGTEDTIENFKNWLSTHNVKLYYPTTLSENILLSNTLQTQLNNIHKATTYQDQTNVNQENNDLPFVIKLSAIKDISSL